MEATYRYQRTDSGPLVAGILLSLLLHLLFLFLYHAPEYKQNISEPVKVRYLPPPPEVKKKKEKATEEEKKGQIVDTTKPKKEEAPLTKQLLSEFDSRGHFTQGKKADHSESRRRVVPMNRPQGQIQEHQKQVKTEKKKEVKKVKEVRKEKQQKKQASQTKRREGTKGTKAERKERTKTGETKAKPKKKESPVLRKKDVVTTPKGLPNSPLFTRELPMVDGIEYARTASVRTGDEELSDSDTISLDTKSDKYVSYFNHIKRKIELVWQYPRSASLNGISGRMKLKFTLKKNGALVRVVLLSSTGSKLLDEAAIKAIQEASPYNPFPKSITNSKLNITADFVYYPGFDVGRNR